MQLIPHLRAAGHRCALAQSFPQKYDYFRWLGFRPSQWLKRMVRRWHLCRAWCGRFDAVILERELFHNESWDLERRFRKLPGAMVLDIDDAVFLTFPEKLPRLAEMADLIIAGNPWLQKWASQYNSHVVTIPTCVDTIAYHPSKRREESRSRPIVGWMGTSGNVVFLKEAAAGLRQAARQVDFELRVIAGGVGELHRLDLDGVHVVFQQWRPQTEALDVAQFDIGIMPLFDDQWSRCKCGLKLLQYMACGIPSIASPVGVNSHIVESGVNGFLAESPEQWATHLAALLSDKSLRSSMGQAARETVERKYSVEANLPLWIDSVKEATRRSQTSP